MAEKVSVITISYNSEKTIEKTLQSVLAQSYRPLEYVLVDGGSQDATIGLIEKYIPLFEKKGIEVNFISEPDDGISDAFNKGIARSTGNIIGITNSDDCIADEAIARIVSVFDEETDVVCGDMLWRDETHKLEYVRKSKLDLEKLKYDMVIMHPTCYVTKKAYDRYGVYDVRLNYVMDKDLLARFYRSGAKFKYVSEVLAIVSAGGASDANANKVYEEGIEIAVRNGVPRWKAILRSGYKKLYLKIVYIVKGNRCFSKFFWKSIEEICRRKPYLYDLYRWTGKVDIKTLAKWIFIPKYRIVYLKRKCEIHREQHKIRFMLFRLLYEHFMIKYGVDIAAKTVIGPGFVVRHTGGIAINGNAVIGKDVEILQGVTIGCERRGEREGNPIIGNSVWIGSNATVVGNILVEDNVLIAPGAFVNFNVPKNSIVIGNPGRIIPKEGAVEGYVVNTLNI